MNDLVKIEKHLVGQEVVDAVNARELHEKLQVGRDFSNWIKQRLDEAMAEEGIHFIKMAESGLYAKFGENVSSGRPTIEYIISLDIAKHIAMLERNEIGRKIRQYFIDFEKNTKITMDNWLNNPDAIIEVLQELKRTREIARIEKEAKEEAIRTKAEIGSRREATAMQTASVKAKEVKKLEIELGKAREYASTIAVSKYFGKTKDAYPWQPLKRFCVEHDLEIKKEFNACYGNINCYPAEAWEAAYGIDITKFVR